MFLFECVLIVQGINVIVNPNTGWADASTKQVYALGHQRADC